MVVQSSPVELKQLDLGYLALFLGSRVNEIVLEQMARAGFGNVRESHGYVIQHLIECERSITELAERMGVSQQAASKAVAELVALGFLELSAAEDRRAKRVRLSAQGQQLVQHGRRVRKRIEKRLYTALGVKRYNEARSVLEDCLTQLGGVEAIRQRKVRQPD